MIDNTNQNTKKNLNGRIGTYNSYYRLENETDDELLYRILSNKDNIGSWRMVANILNSLLNVEFSEDKYRKQYKRMLNKNLCDCKSSSKLNSSIDTINIKKYIDSKIEENQSNSLNIDYDEKLRRLEQEKIKYRDERNAWNKQNYAAARLDETLELLDKKLSNIGRIYYDIHQDPIIKSDNDLLVMLSDLHIGATFETPFGEYNTDIANQRLKKYLNEILDIRKIHNSENCIVSLQGDLISGNIHKTIQITNKENVIEQIKIAIEMITSFCYELTKHFKNVFLYCVSGNHSRLIENKEYALHDERLDDLIGWSIGRSLSHINNFHMMNHRNLDIGISDLIIRNKTYISVHGDNDCFDRKGVLDLCSMLGFFPTAVLYGHMHTPSYNEINGVKIIRSGSLCGSGDDYTISKRLSGNPSQTVLICDNNGIKCIYNIELN